MTSGIYTLCDHLCRDCGQRLLQRHDGAHAGIVMCSCCEATALGPVEALCFCGATLRDQDLRLRCAVNPQPTFQQPGRIGIMRLPTYPDVPLPKAVQMALLLRFGPDSEEL